jgi:hypothetical protein
MELKIMRGKRKHQISIKYAALLATLVHLYLLRYYHCHFTSNENNCRSTKRIALVFAASPVIAVN